MRRSVFSFFLVLVCGMISIPAVASTEHIELDKQAWSFDGPFGTFDRNELQRGLKVYRQVCAACHSLKRVRFRELEALGYDEGQIKAIASEYTVTDGPNEEGEMFERPGLPSDHFPLVYPNDNAGKAANNGALPPDLSLIVKARSGGADYIHGLLTGYETPPSGFKLLEGQYYNKAIAGHVIAMPPPLSDGAVQYDDQAPQTVEQYSRDLSAFLAWASEPTMEIRKQTGIKVLFFLIVLCGVMYGIKKKIWSDVH